MWGTHWRKHLSEFCRVSLGLRTSLDYKPSFQESRWVSPRKLVSTPLHSSLVTILRELHDEPELGKLWQGWKVCLWQVSYRVFEVDMLKKGDQRTKEPNYARNHRKPQTRQKWQSLPLLSPWVGRKWFTWTLAPTCLNLAVLVNSSQAPAPGPFLLWRCGPSWFSLPQAMCALGPARGLNCHLHFPSVLPASVASGNNVLLSIFYLKHLDSQLLFFNCGDWTSPNYYLILPDTPVWLYDSSLLPKPAGKRPKLHIRCNLIPPTQWGNRVKPEKTLLLWKQVLSMKPDNKWEYSLSSCWHVTSAKEMVVPFLPLSVGI